MVIFDKGFEQGDQMGRIFAHWAIVYPRQIFLKIMYGSSPNFTAIFSTGKIMH
jgi:hypothetical protein